MCAQLCVSYSGSVKECRQHAISAVNQQVEAVRSLIRQCCYPGGGPQHGLTLGVQRHAVLLRVPNRCARGGARASFEARFEVASEVPQSERYPVEVPGEAHGRHCERNAGSPKDGQPHMTGAVNQQGDAVWSGCSLSTAAAVLRWLCHVYCFNFAALLPVEGPGEACVRVCGCLGIQGLGFSHCGMLGLPLAALLLPITAAASTCYKTTSVSCSQA